MPVAVDNKAANGYAQLAARTVAPTPLSPAWRRASRGPSRRIGATPHKRTSPKWLPAIIGILLGRGVVWPPCSDSDFGAGANLWDFPLGEGGKEKFPKMAPRHNRNRNPIKEGGQICGRLSRPRGRRSSARVGGAAHGGRPWGSAEPPSRGRHRPKRTVEPPNGSAEPPPKGSRRPSEAVAAHPLKTPPTATPNRSRPPASAAHCASVRRICRRMGVRLSCWRWPCRGRRQQR